MTLTAVATTATRLTVDMTRTIARLSHQRKRAKQNAHLRPANAQFEVLISATIIAGRVSEAPDPRPMIPAPPVAASEGFPMIRGAWPALVLAVAACDGTPQPPPPAPSVSPPAGPGRNVECAGGEAHVLTTMSTGPDDLVVGSIKWPGLRSWATANPRNFGDPATGDYKIGAEVRAGSTVTVSVAGGGAGLEYGQDW